MVYGSAHPSYIKKLNPIQKKGFRLCLGGFRTSPVTSLHVEADELPLDLRREKLSVQYAMKVAANPLNPAYQCIFENEYTAVFEGKPNTITPFGMRIQDPLDEIAFDPNLVAKFKFPETPPWMYTPINVDFSLAETKKEDTSPDYFLRKYREINQC